MSPSDALHELSAIADSLTAQPDLIELLSDHAERTAHGLGAGATGLLVDSPENGLALLAASSRRSAEIEMYQALVDDGPCTEALHGNAIVISTHPADIIGRWRTAGPVIVGAGYQSAMSVPVRWRGHAFGALNTFFRDPATFSTYQVETATIAADLAAVAIVHAGHQAGRADVGRAVEAAFDDRAVVDQACAVLTRDSTVTSENTFVLLRAAAIAAGTTLTGYAREVLARAARGERWDGA